MGKAGFSAFVSNGRVKGKAAGTATTQADSHTKPSACATKGDQGVVPGGRLGRGVLPTKDQGAVLTACSCMRSRFSTFVDRFLPSASTSVSVSFLVSNFTGSFTASFKGFSYSTV